MIKNGDILYHGSYTVVNNPLLSECKIGKDFGKGFYVTTDEKQARLFTKTSVKKAISDEKISSNVSCGYVSCFRYFEKNKLKVFSFQDADSEWLHCVVAHRKRKYVDVLNKWQFYDIMIGKIANDDTNLVITTYMDGLYGEVFSERADEIAIGFLEPDNLKDQICFRSQAAIDCLEFMDSYEVKLK